MNVDAGGGDSPLRSRRFRAVWTVIACTQVGAVMHEAACVWTMVSIDRSPVWISVLQASFYAPLFLLGLPAGTLSDLIDRSRVLRFATAALGALALTLAVVTATGLLNAPGLGLFGVATGVGIAFATTAWQALLPELVSVRQLPQAVTFNGLAINLARSAGPLLAGILLVVTGPAACFTLNGLSLVAATVVLSRHVRRDGRARDTTREPFLSALLAGLRYVRHTPALRGSMLRLAAFVLPASCLLVLLPLLAAERWHLGAAGYCLLLASFGAGAIVSACTLPRIRSRWTTDRILTSATVASALCPVVAASIPNVIVVASVMPLGGAGWMTIVSTLNANAQRTSAPWVRGRALAANLLALQGPLAVGAITWGLVAARLGLQPALLLSSVLLLLTLLFAFTRVAEPAATLPLDPTNHWPEPRATHATLDLDRAASVTIDYQIALGDRAAFLKAIREVGRARRRTGATHWEIIEDVESPGRFQERFTLPSWDEHLRQHRRVSHWEKQIEAQADAFHRGEQPPVVRHWLVA